MKKFIITQEDFINLRIDKWLKINFSSLNQSFIEKNLRKSNIKVNNKKVTSNYKIQSKDEIKIFNYADDIYLNIEKEFNKKNIPSKYIKLFQSNIIYENEDFIILDKWTGIATQGGSKINISIDHIIKGISIKYNLVHRLDRETSGLLIIAKNLKTTKYFGVLFKDQQIEKIYIAICQGIPKNIESEINLLIEDKKNNKKNFNTVTRYKVINTNNNLSNIVFFPKTGKTHQLRIVSKHLGCPIIGDTKYNIQDKYNFEKLKLNAHILKFKIYNQSYFFVSNLPDHFNLFCKKNYLKITNLKKIKNSL